MMPTRYPEHPKRDPLQQAARIAFRLITTGIIIYSALVILSLPGA